ncbi:MAG: energy transducer TonB [Myxococcota bacterium]|jgi:colicin import membrane protein/protein TonB
MSSETPFEYLNPRPRIGLAVVISVAVHLAVVLTLVFWPAKKIVADTLAEKAMIARMVKLGVEIDRKMLPRIDSSNPSSAESEININREAQKEEADRKKDEKTRRDEFARKLASSMDRLKKMMDRTTSRNEQATGSPEGSPEGDATEASDGDVYLTQVFNYVRNNYTVPSIISESERKSLKATIIIYLEEDGRLRETTFEKRSGNVHFDNALESAVKKASPFPPPPKDRRRQYRDQGIGLNFSI